MNARRRCHAFTLIELLVVVAIIAMLISILIPALTRAREQSKRSVCLSNQRSLGLAIQAYAYQNRDAIPRGPDLPLPYFPSQGFDDWTTNQVRIGPLHAAQGLGDILTHDLNDPTVLFCPADDSTDPTEELEKLNQPGGDEDVFCSYYYRQLDQTTRDRIDNLGENALELPARALLLDANSLGADVLHRTNHRGRTVNILYLDGHASARENPRDVFSIRAQDYYGFPQSVERRLNEIIVAADYAEGGDPLKTPPLP